ncbi:hypothetical protein PIB30_081795 [Stylosanthes scabra]|uniref:Reverse transcriptase domain-containing protein n=1 Tax=Stylosanthes scabra TaxID=79078 RepID=A0ABU6TT72_9FABA|nr:hypothetical protein [Stylosanthes scabra]
MLVLQSPPERACHVFGAVAGEAKYLSHSDPGSLLFDPEIERTLRRTRQAKRRAKLVRLALNNNHFYSFDCSSDFNTRSSFSVSGTSTMAERLTLKQLGGASTAFDNQPNRFPELNANIELKSRLINLLPNFCGRPGEDPIKHIKDFEVICATTRRTGGDDDA